MAIDLIKELEELRRQILTMAAAVEKRLDQTTAALLEGDIEAAQLVKAGDREIDQMELDIESECLRILALSHPVASDLRLVLSVMRINTDLERIGDLVRSCAKRAIDLNKLGVHEVPDSLRTMLHETRRMLGDSITALADENVELANRVRAADDRVDDLQKELFAWAQREIPAHVDQTAMILDVLSISRKLERIADIATNIAEDVIFLAIGSLARHSKVDA